MQASEKKEQISAMVEAAASLLPVAAGHGSPSPVWKNPHDSVLENPHDSVLQDPHENPHDLSRGAPPGVIHELISIDDIIFFLVCYSILRDAGSLLFVSRKNTCEDASIDRDSKRSV
jgi:hypothetical protein